MTLTFARVATNHSVPLEILLILFQCRWPAITLGKRQLAYSKDLKTWDGLCCPPLTFLPCVLAVVLGRFSFL